MATTWEPRFTGLGKKETIGTRTRRSSGKGKWSGIKHRIYLFYHLAWGQPPNLIPKSTDSIQTEPRAYSQANVQDIQIQAKEDPLSISIIWHFKNVIWMESESMEHFELFCIILWRCIQVVCTNFQILVFTFSEYSMVWCTMVCWAIYALKDIWVVSHLGLLWKKYYKYLCTDNCMTISFHFTVLRAQEYNYWVQQWLHVYLL